MGLALGVFALTLFLVVARPRGLNIALGAAAGAVLALLLGLVDLDDLGAVWHATWNATLTLIALIVLSLLDEVGLFRFVALHLARRAGGRTDRLFALLVVFGALLAALFANDGAVLILTPIALELCSLLELPRAASLAVMFAVGFIVDAASLPLVTSNLTNIITADLFGLDFTRYAAVMLPVNLAGVAVGRGVLWWMFRPALPGRYDRSSLPEPAAGVRDALTCGVGAGLMGLLLLGFFLAPAMHVPVSAVALTAAVALLLTARARRQRVRPVLRSAPWDVVVFSMGMYLVVYALRDAGLTILLADVLTALAPHGAWAVAVGTGGLVAALSAVTNNLPAVLIGALSIEHAAVAPGVRDTMIHANIVAADIGSKLTPIGSLATLLWLGLLAKRGLHVSWGEYLRLALVVTPPVLMVTLAAVVLRLG
ncbi:arsenical efflux pump membrane protein ArsB [Deinococcus sp. AB2017081]|uniref:arsenical efflux pump membrane protein ArsB n=1 Tax=Deinococcus sp. AB2017081 TaxID=3093660 RepID=UPI002ACC3697|nr:arsenical efflux pump membrane protein ArsB [Deinococcus sp. AB2017081]WQE97301.1 arsenical efflux pump membrane protein ArsB [Deinococcus sp. AB2017081]